LGVWTVTSIVGGWENGECEDRDKVLPVVMMVGKSSRLRQLVWEELGVDAADGVKYVEWIGRSRRIYEEEMTDGLEGWDLITLHLL
jgi:hypothetical protein